MNKIITHLDLDLASSNEYKVINAQQLDNNTRRLEVNLFHEGKIYDITNVTKIELQGFRGDGETIKTPLTNDGNNIIIDFDNTILGAKGVCKLKIALFGEDNKLLSSFPFVIRIDQNVYDETGVIASPVYLELENELKNIEDLKSDIETKLDDNYFVLKEDKDVAGGVPSLDNNTKVPISELYEATTTNKGITQLTDSVTSTSTTTAATPNSVKSVKDSLDSEISRATTKENEIANNLSSHTGNTSNPHSVTKAQVGLGNVEDKSSATIRGEITDSNVTTALGYTPLNQSLKGSANGLAELDSNGKVPSSQLPSFVDDVIEGYLSGGKFYKESAHTTEISGESGKIYIDLSTEKTYRWSGSTFVVISETLALGETSSTAYRGDRGKTAYDHSQSTHARTDATKVEKSSTNGNIKINGTETTVYDDTEVKESISQQSTEMMDIKMLGWSVPSECPIQNEVNGNQFIQKVGRVDLGSLDWNYQYGNFSSSSLQGIVYSESNSKPANAYIDGYQVTSDSSLGNNKEFSISSAGSIYIVNTDYTDVSAFKSNISGKYLYYELKTPITMTIDGNEIGETVSDVRKETTVNLLKPTLGTVTQNGVTCTNNGDGTYTFNGTNSSSTKLTFFVGNVTITNKDRYKLVGCPTNKSTGNHIHIYLHNDDYSIVSNDYGNGKGNDTILPSGVYYIRIEAIENETVNDIFKPMLTTNLNATYDDFVPYTGSTGQINSDVADIIDKKADKEKYGDTTVSVGRKADSTEGKNSFAFGSNVTASGDYSHAEGSYTTALGYNSHAEGESAMPAPVTSSSTNDDIISEWNTNKFSLAKGQSSHVENANCLALGDGSHAEGIVTIASGNCSHSEGGTTTASGNASHAEGAETTSSGHQSHSEGEKTIASGNDSHAEGNKSVASGVSSHAEGQRSNAMGAISHAEGASEKALPDTITSSTTNDDVISAWNTTKFSLAKGTCAHTEGLSCLSLGNSSHAEGYRTIAKSISSHAEGSSTISSGDGSHAEGKQTTASGQSSHAEGDSTTASGMYSHAEGNSTTALDNQHAQGHYNNTTTATKNSTSGTSTGTAFVIGNGTYSSPSNAYRVTGEGVIYATNAAVQTGADYAEYFEWSDGNPNNEDRVGLFVTFDEDNPEKIRIANGDDDYILGIVSGMPSVIGNGDEDWKKRYVLDDFGRYIQETFEYKEEGKTKTGTKWKENPEYDSTKPYTPRDERAEWSAIGLVGVLSVYDDGTCQVNGYCKCKNNGIATAVEKGADTYRVIKRVTDNIVKVVLK